MKTMVIGVYYTNTASDAQASITARFTSAETRAAWFAARQSEKPAGLIQMVAKLSEELQVPLTFRYSEKAGCSMCPCSPGFELVAKPATVEQVRTLEMFQRLHPRKDQRISIWEQPGGWHIQMRDRHDRVTRDETLPRVS